MQPVASPLTITWARAGPLTPVLRALRPVHVSPLSYHSSRGPEFTAEILLWRAHACQGNKKVAMVFSAGLRTRWARTVCCLRTRCASRSEGRLAPQVLQRDVAREPARAVRVLPGRLDLLADAAELARAARVEAAAGGRPPGARHRAFESDGGGGRGRIGHGDRGEQRARVRVIRGTEDLVHRARPVLATCGHPCRVRFIGVAV